MPNTTETAEILDQLQQDTARARSVVARTYKQKYAERQLTARGRKGVDRRVRAQSCGDWLADELALRIRTTPRAPMDVATLVAIFDANGVEHNHLPRNTPSWQGRLRMSGGISLRKIVAASGFLVLPDGTELPAPRAWCERNQS